MIAFQNLEFPKIKRGNHDWAPSLINEFVDSFDCRVAINVNP